MVTARAKAGSTWPFVEEEGGGRCGQSPSGQLGRKMTLDTEVGQTWGALGAEVPLPPENTPAVEAGQGCALRASLCLLWEGPQGRTGADAVLAAGGTVAPALEWAWQSPDGVWFQVCSAGSPGRSRLWICWGTGTRAWTGSRNGRLGAPETWSPAGEQSIKPRGKSLKGNQSESGAEGGPGKGGF